VITPEQVAAANRALSWIHLFKPWALAFVAVGVAYEFIADRLERPYTALIETAHEEELARLRASSGLLQKDMAAASAREKEASARISEAERGSAEASAKAEGFRLDIAKAKESAAQAEARAAEANLELERFKTPRRLSGSLQSSIADRLRLLGMRQVDVIIIGDPPEIANFTGDIVAAIRQADWTVTGVLVGTRRGSAQDVTNAADALISALQSAGVVSGRFFPQFGDELPMAMMGDNWDQQNIAPIRILVGAKP
jgi:hypothetical protein